MSAHYSASRTQERRSLPGIKSRTSRPHKRKEEEELPDLEMVVENDEEPAVLVEVDLENWDRPFPPEEADQWELRHARRRGNESSYRHQRWNQFYPIFIDEKAKRVVEIGESIPLDLEPDFRKKGALIPIWPIDKEGNHRCWRFISTSMARLLDQKRLVVGKQDKKTRNWTLNIWEPEKQKEEGGGHWGGGMFINSYDMARFGYLFLRNGKWKDRTIVSEKWIEMARTPGSDNKTYGYANWYLNTDRKPLPAAPATAVRFVGNGSNIIYIDWDNDIVAVFRWIKSEEALNDVIAKMMSSMQVKTTAAQ